MIPLQFVTRERITTQLITPMSTNLLSTTPVIATSRRGSDFATEEMRLENSHLPIKVTK